MERNVQRARAKDSDEEGEEGEEEMEAREEGDTSGEEFSWSGSEEMTEEGGYLASQVSQSAQLLR